MRRAINALAVVCLSVCSALPLRAQAWAYPSFQPPRTSIREFNFGVADADAAGTTLLFQWREESGPNTQLSLDVGIADPDFPDSDLLFFLGGQFGWQLARSSAEAPLDFLLTIGANLALGDGTLFRVPFGVSIGHRFPLEGQLALTPYAHPRLSVDICSSCDVGDDTEVNINFDLGLNFEISRTLSLRASWLLTGSDRFDDGFGLSLALTPLGLQRGARR
jgi:hypothetical protein